MLNMARKTEKAYNDHMSLELKKVPVYVYWQALINKPK
jgi:hypothetical protein